jgi:predicted HicB family RNase H-like nuclease
MKTLSIRIPEELHKALVELAEQDRRSLNNLIVVILEDFVRLAEEEQKET